MLNVAVSRAKDSFLVFGEMAIFDPTSRTPSGLLAHYVFKEESNELTDIPLPPRPKANFSARISSLEGHVKALSNVLDQARNSVLIVSPFISINAIEQDELVPKIRKAVGRDVRVVVYPDAFLDKEGTGLRETAVRGRAALEEAGAELKILNGIHSKTLCCDQDLFIEGSFNWLSASRGAKSQFRRYEASLCYQGTDAAQVIGEALSEIESLQPSATEGTH